MTINDLPDEDQAELKSALQKWADSGVENPKISLGENVAVQLTDSGDLEIIQVPLEETVSAEDGE